MPAWLDLGSLDLVSILAIVAAGVVAGFVNTLAGGGSLLTLPALLLAGLPADVANGTNRVGVAAQSVAGALAFRKAGKLDFDDWLGLFLPTILGSLTGSLVAAYVLPRSWVEPVLLGTMLTMAIVMLLRPKAFEATEGQTLKVRESPGGALGLFGAGFYGGFVQAGVGFVLLTVVGGVLRYDLVRANAFKIVAVLVFTLVALPVFILADQVSWVPGILLGVATAIGSQIGVRFALNVSPKVLRAIVVAGVVVACVAAFFK
ncbi:MAG: sulfite exporter TauE/SafE family protein [Sandaracinus sp.]|nr:sulfite exporter TauE/SafE family protein [Sandaracinus sp.]MCB9619119.1 sulfite exporter TauE/SafE family protein [Sandaracinus sp.]MCB9632702.1 sulfite exporter TauE/SafE family protein [Sandaracinus sp.]